MTTKKKRVSNSIKCILCNVGFETIDELNEHMNSETAAKMNTNIPGIDTDTIKNKDVTRHPTTTISAVLKMTLQTLPEPTQDQVHTPKKSFLCGVCSKSNLIFYIVRSSLGTILIKYV